MVSLYSIEEMAASAESYRLLYFLPLSCPLHTANSPEGFPRNLTPFSHRAQAHSQATEAKLISKELFQFCLHVTIKQTNKKIVMFLKSSSLALAYTTACVRTALLQQGRHLCFIVILKIKSNQATIAMSTGFSIFSLGPIYPSGLSPTSSLN